MRIQPMSIRAIMMACVAASYGFSASAATVVPYAGNVFVSQGVGFQKINGATLVKVGDAVMVSPDGLAQVHLDDGNVITVSPGAVLSVPAKARPKDAALPNGAGPTADLPVTAAPATQTETCDPCGPGILGLLAAGALVGGGLAGAAALAHEGAPAPPPSPASP
jgi:hypothetical protein